MVFVEYELKQSEVPVVGIAAGLGPFKATTWLGPPWQDRLKVYGVPDIGEIRLYKDLEVLPTGKALKALYLVDDTGPVIRWVVEGFQGITNIEHLVDPEDIEREGMRDGYVYPERRDDNLWIRVQG